MTYQGLIDYLAGLITAGFLACGLFFFRFYSRSRDILFLAFAVAFLLLALNAVVVVAIQEPDETRSWFYLIRVVAYMLIVLAIIRKNVSDAGED